MRGSWRLGSCWRERSRLPTGASAWLGMTKLLRGAAKRLVGNDKTLRVRNDPARFWCNLGLAYTVLHEPNCGLEDAGRESGAGGGDGHEHSADCGDDAGGGDHACAHRGEPALGRDGGG